MNLDEFKDAMDDFANVLRLEPKTSEVYKKTENEIEICKLLEICFHKTKLHQKPVLPPHIETNNDKN